MPSRTSSTPPAPGSRNGGQSADSTVVNVAITLVNVEVTLVSGAIPLTNGAITAVHGAITVVDGAITVVDVAITPVNVAITVVDGAITPVGCAPTRVDVATIRRLVSLPLSSGANLKPQIDLPPLDGAIPLSVGATYFQIATATRVIGAIASSPLSWKGFIGATCLTKLALTPGVAPVVLHAATD